MAGNDSNAVSSSLRTDIRFLAAVLLAGVVGLFLGHLQGRESEASEHRTYEYQQIAKRNASINCADYEPTAIADCIYDEINSARQQSESEQDLYAQQRMAFWALILTVITAATTLISWVALRYLRDTFEQTAKGARAAADATEAMIAANELAERLGEAQVRCYLSGISAQVGFASTGEVVVNCTIKNSGQSPARSAKMVSQLTFYNGKRLWVVTEASKTIPSTDMDVEATAEQTLSNYFESKTFDLEPFDTLGSVKYSLSLKATIVAFDVFGKIVSEELNSFGTTDKDVPDADWIELKPTGSIDSKYIRAKND